VPLVWLTGLFAGRFNRMLIVKTLIFALAYLHVGYYFITHLWEESSEALWGFYGVLLLLIAPLAWLLTVIFNISEFITIYQQRKSSPENTEETDDMLCAGILHLLCLIAVVLVYKTLYCLYVVLSASC
jgi:hypothetical protein